MEGRQTQAKSRPRAARYVSAERFELSTNGLKGHCSAIELRARGRLTHEERTAF